MKPNRSDHDFGLHSFQVSVAKVERFAFYERAKQAFAIVHTGYVEPVSFFKASLKKKKTPSCHVD